jgi:hypothetical protein
MLANTSRLISRREILAGGAALAAATVLPKPSKAAAKYRRWNISDPNCPARVIDSYKKAIKAMLSLPPTDARNWYRYTLIHTIDCPHGNWWFLPWHRGYIGWFEQICRELSGDPDFALPYWDWTAEPRIPKVMFEDVLDPNNDAFIASASEFKKQFQDAIAKSNYWAMTKDEDGNPTPSPQFIQMLTRSIRFPEDLWFDIIDSPAGGLFFDRGHARGLTAAQPDLLIPNRPPEKQSVLKAVSVPMILDALGPRDFLSFASPKALNHSSSSGFAILENQPHNLVHNCVGGAYNGVGGFMQAFMSPTDPIFYLHHANMDRLWDVWTRKQTAKGLAILPDGYPKAPGDAVADTSDYAQWANELFVFFVDQKGNGFFDQKGNPTKQATAGEYATIGAFDYDYSRGSGEEVVPVTPPTPVAQAEVRPLRASLSVHQVGGARIAEGVVSVPLQVIQQQSEPEQPKLAATITVDVPGIHGHQDLDVFLKRPDGSSIFVATISMFGHHIMHQSVTVQVPLSTAIADLQRTANFTSSPTLNIQVVPSDARVVMTTMRHAGMIAASPARANEVSAISLQSL